jgi:hypothetical protein
MIDRSAELRDTTPISLEEAFTRATGDWQPFHKMNIEKDNLNVVQISMKIGKLAQENNCELKGEFGDPDNPVSFRKKEE